MSEDFINQLALASTYYEQASESVYIPSKDQSVIQKNIYDLFKETFIPHSAEVAEAQETQEKLVRNLTIYTGSKDNAIKELDFVRTQVDHLAMEYGQIAAAYADLYKLSKSVNFSIDELHNLFMSTMLAARKEDLSEEDIAEILSRMGEMLQNEFVTIDDFKKAIGYKFKAADNWVKEAPKLLNMPDANEETLFQSSEFLSMFSDYTKEHTPDVTPLEFKPKYVKANYNENRMYDRDLLGEEALEALLATYSFFAGWFTFNRGNLGDFYRNIKNIKNIKSLLKGATLSAIITTLIEVAVGDSIETYKKIQQHYDNGGLIKYNPKWRDILNGGNTPILDGGITLDAPYLDENDIEDSPENQYVVPDNTRLNLLNIRGNNDIDMANSISGVHDFYKPDLEVEVKRILANTIDDFVQLKGFSVRKT